MRRGRDSGEERAWHGRRCGSGEERVWQWGEEWQGDVGSKSGRHEVRERIPLLPTPFISLVTLTHLRLGTISPKLVFKKYFL